MDPLTTLDLATAEFDRRVRLITTDQWQLPTALGDWTVRDLIDHVIGGNRMATRLFGGGSRDEAVSAFALSADDTDLAVAFDQSAAEQAAAARAPGALDGTVHHPMGDIKATDLVLYRIMDLAVHGWDLARATGGDEEIDPDVVQAIWDTLSPMAAYLGQVGVFGDGPSGTIPEDAPLQIRMLDLSGRRF